MKTIYDMAIEYADDKIDAFGVQGVPNRIKDIEGFMRDAYLAGAEQSHTDGWYNTSEDVPSDFRSVLIVYPDNVYLIAYYDRYMQIWRDTTNHNEICEPLAWRELPKFNPNL